MLPITATVGILATFRIAGPLNRIEAFLTEVRDGSKPADCIIREGDELRELCDLVNEVTAGLREPGVDPAASEREAA